MVNHYSADSDTIVTTLGEQVETRQSRMCCILEDHNEKIYDTITIFEILKCFMILFGFKRCFSNNISFKYYIGIEHLQCNDMTNSIYKSICVLTCTIDKHNEINTSSENYDSNFNQENTAKLTMVDFIISQSNMANNIVNHLSILFLRHLLRKIRIFQNYLISHSTQYDVFNTSFSQYILYIISRINRTYTKFTIDNFTHDSVTDSTSNLTHDALYNNIFNNWNIIIIMWTSTVNEYGNTIYSENNDFNDSFVILLSIINNMFRSSVSNTIIGIIVLEAEINVLIINYSFSDYISCHIFHTSNLDNCNASNSNNCRSYEGLIRRVTKIYRTNFGYDIHNISPRVLNHVFQIILSVILIFAITTLIVVISIAMHCHLCATDHLVTKNHYHAKGRIKIEQEKRSVEWQEALSKSTTFERRLAEKAREKGLIIHECNASRFNLLQKASKMGNYVENIDVIHKSFGLVKY